MRERSTVHSCVSVAGALDKQALVEDTVGLIASPMRRDESPLEKLVGVSKPNGRRIEDLILFFYACAVCCCQQ